MFPSLLARQFAIRRGEVTMLAGQAGVGKSTLALALAYRSKEPTLYLSADSHMQTQGMRLISMILNQTTDQVERWMEDKDWAASVLGQADWITWSFESSLDMKVIEDEILAHIELHGKAPSMVVLDNLTDIVGETGDEWASARGLLKDCKFLAREYETAVLVLHHVADKFIPHGQCPARWDIMGRLSATPASILTLIQDEGTGWLGASPVKSRYGPADPGGKTVTWLSMTAATMQISDPTEVVNA